MELAYKICQFFTMKILITVLINECGYNSLAKIHVINKKKQKSVWINVLKKHVTFFFNLKF